MMDEYDGSIDGELPEEVHPIFHRINFPNVDYDKLLPALKLANLFIDTDCLLDFWFALFFGPMQRVRHGSDEEEWHWAFFRPDSGGKLSAKDTARTGARFAHWRIWSRSIETINSKAKGLQAQ